MESDKTIYIFTDWYIPAFKAGGPIQSVFNLATLLSKNFNVKIVTSNTDYGSISPLKNIVSNQWQTIAPNHEILYLSSKARNFHTIKQICSEAKGDIIFINGVFSFYFSILPLFFSNYFNINKSFVAVRGMLHQSALSVKPLKKQIFLAFARGFGLYKKSVLISTSDYENNEIEKCLGKVKISCLPNIPVQPVNLEIIESKQFKNENGQLRLLFLGRISPEKNPITLVNALMDITFPVSVVFIGATIDDNYFSLFNIALKKLPAHINYEWFSEKPHDQIQKMFNDFDLMILPSLGENFGHAIFESFANGVPVIIGNNTPWKEIEKLNAGLEVNPLQSNEIVQALIRFNNMQTEEYKKWQIGAHAKAKNYFMTNNFEKLYLTLFT